MLNRKSFQHCRVEGDGEFVIQPQEGYLYLYMCQVLYDDGVPVILDDFIVVFAFGTFWKEVVIFSWKEIFLKVLMVKFTRW